jgi:branched-chain amino acid transport system permease protein
MVSPEQIIVNGIGLSALYILLALGLTLIFGVMRIANFAHGELYMLGAYGMYLFYGKGGLPFLVALIPTMVLVGLLSILIERGVFRPLRNDPFSSLVAATGVMFIIQVLTGQIWGLGYNKPVPRAFTKVFHILDATIPQERIVVIVVTLVLAGGLWYFLEKIKLGRAMRACTQDAEAASLQGISLNTMSAIAMGIGGVLASGAGALVSPSMAVNPYMGGDVLFKSFVIVMVGGGGSVGGGIISAVFFGFLDSIITSVADSSIANLFGFLFMFAILVIRPQGFFGREA